MELKGHVALVTGAGRGIGRAIAMILAREGARVVVNSLTPVSAKRTAQDIIDQGYEALPFPTDVTKRKNVSSMVQKIIMKFGKIDILVNNVGFASHMLVEDMPPDVWDRFININLTTPFNVAKAVLPHMIGEKYGKIIFIGSIAATRISGLGSADYTAAKYGTHGFAKHLAYEVARHNINVNIVNPGVTLTDMTYESTTEPERKQMETEYPLGRISLPEDIAEAVLFLATDRSRQITGHAIEVEGGALIMSGSGYVKNMERRIKISKVKREEWEAGE